ncbi:TonB-dependent receptor [Sphingomonadaceae bacterium jetA1]|jgi:outer membrane receptor protein involved in Fe transport|uniref:TonB-dependent receptor domain-containing protein n=1 Tax=Facivitalis istanbulensis TaxID=3075838 RepID=UPI0034747FC4
MNVRDLTILATCTAVAIGAVAPASAQSLTQFSIGAGPLEPALRAFSRQTGVPVLADSKLLRGRNTAGVAGKRSAENGLQQLLRGTGLAFRRGSDGFIVMAAASPQNVRPPAAAPAPQRIARNTPRQAHPETTVDLNDIIVTGSNRAQVQFDASYAITSFDSDAIRKLAPVNLSDLMSRAPGIYSESNAGEVQNVYRVRGIPNEGSFVAILEDGMPLYPDSGGIGFFKGDAMTRTDLMTRRAEIVRGGPSAVFGSNAIALIDVQTRRGTEKPEGAAELTLGDVGLYRLDGYYSGPIAPGLTVAAGGFYRYNEGYRDMGFRADQGGQFHANVTKAIDGGQITLGFRYMNDKNGLYMPVPLADPRDPSVSLAKLIDPFTGMLGSSELKNVKMISPEQGVIIDRRRDLSDGRYNQTYSFDLLLDKEFGDGWLFVNKFRYTDMTVAFDALYSTRNPQDAVKYRNGFLAAAQKAFGSDVSLAYQYSGNGQPFDPATTMGLVVEAQYRLAEVKAHAFMDDIRISRQFEWIGKHDATIGVFASKYFQDYSELYQDHLFEMRANGRQIDMVAMSAGGKMVGSVTDKGVLRYATANKRTNTSSSLIAIYASDNWDITDKLRLEGGIRYEFYDYDGSATLSNRINGGRSETLADDNIVNLTGKRKKRHENFSSMNWTIAANYEFSRLVGMYARAARASRVAADNVATGDNELSKNDAEQYELGLKLNLKKLQVFATGFYTIYSPFMAADGGINPNTGLVEQNLTYIGTSKSPGVEVAASWGPTRFFRLDMSMTYNDATLSNLTNRYGGALLSVNGNTPIRQPKIYGYVMPTLSFDVGGVGANLFSRVNLVGRRWTDVKNTTALPGYQSVTLGFSLNRDAWNLQVVGDNIFNAYGMNEGNPRSDQINGQGTPTPIYGRPIYSRNFRLTLTRKF